MYGSLSPPSFFFQAEDGIRDWNCDWSSDVCSSDLFPSVLRRGVYWSVARPRSSAKVLLSHDRRERRRGLLPWISRSLEGPLLVVFETLSPMIPDGVRSDWERRLELL